MTDNSQPPPPQCQTATRITVRYWIIRVKGNQLNLSFSINYKPWEQFKPNLTNQNLGFYAINLIFTFPFTIGKILVKNNGYLSRPGLVNTKVLMQGKLFQRCTHFLYCSVFFGRKIKRKTDVKAWQGINFHKNNLLNILVIGNYYVKYQNYQN